MLGPDDLVFCSGTLLKGSIQEMVEAAVAGNYQALTLWPQDVDRAHALVESLGANIVTAPSEGPWAPGYYYVLFEDPDGIRLEVNHVPGKGVLAEDAGFNPGADYS